MGILDGMWFVYILKCADQSFYTGMSDDVAKRFILHQTGKGAKYTRSHKPVKVIYTESFATKSEALKRECEIKSWTRAQKMSRLSLDV